MVSQGRIFPGLVVHPPTVTGEEDKARRVEAAIKEARQYDHELDTVWTDSSRLDSGGGGGGVAWYEEVAGENPPIAVERRGVVMIGKKKAQRGRTYQGRHRSLRGAQSGWRGADFGMGSGHEAYDAELAAIAYGLLHLAGRRETGRRYTIFTDSTAAMITSDAGTGPGDGAADHRG